MINSLFKRIMAYLIDMMLVSIIVSCFASSSIINVQLDDYTEAVNGYNDLEALYSEQSNNEIETCEELEGAISDDNLTEEKYVLNYEELRKNFDEEEIDEEEYDSQCLMIVEEYNSNKISEDVYNEEINKYLYNSEKYSVVYYIISIVTCILYFVFFQGFTGGQTLGKKIMRLKVVAKDGKEVGYKKLFIRTMFLYDILFCLLIIVSVSFLSMDYFFTAYNILYLINYILSLVIVFMVSSSKDRIGLHDMVAHTKVIELDNKMKQFSEK